MAVTDRKTSEIDKITPKKHGHYVKNDAITAIYTLVPHSLTVKSPSFHVSLSCRGSLEWNKSVVLNTIWHTCLKHSQDTIGNIFITSNG